MRGRAVAEKFWPGEDPTGKRVTFETAEYEVLARDRSRQWIYRGNLPRRSSGTGTGSSVPACW